MSNAFDKLMERSQNQEEQPSTVGRPMHDHWFGFERIYVDKKVQAKCLNCEKSFANTHSTRLANHR